MKERYCIIFIDDKIGLKMEFPVCQRMVPHLLFIIFNYGKLLQTHNSFSLT